MLEVVSQPHSRSKWPRIGNPLPVVNEGTRKFGTLVSEIIYEEFCRPLFNRNPSCDTPHCPAGHAFAVDDYDIAICLVRMSDMRHDVRHSSSPKIPFIAGAQIKLKLRRKRQRIAQSNVVSGSNDPRDFGIKERERSSYRQSLNRCGRPNKVAFEAGDVSICSVIGEE